MLIRSFLIAAFLCLLALPAAGDRLITGDGDPSGHHGCQNQGDDLYRDDTTGALWICSTPGYEATAVWTNSGNTSSGFQFDRPYLVC